MRLYIVAVSLHYSSVDTSMVDIIISRISAVSTFISHFVMESFYPKRSHSYFRWNRLARVIPAYMNVTYVS